MKSHQTDCNKKDTVHEKEAPRPESNTEAIVHEKDVLRPCQEILTMSSNPDHRQHDGDDHTCMSSVTGFNFELYPESGMMYPALESIQSNADVTSLHAASLPKLKGEKTQPQAPTTGTATNKSATDGTNEKLTLKTLKTDTISGKTWLSEPQNSAPSALQLVRSPNVQADEHYYPGAYAVHGADFIEENDNLEEDTVTSQPKVEEEEDEEEFEVHEAHLMDDDDENNETASVTRSSHLDLTDEVVEGKPFKSIRQPVNGNRHGKPIVWSMMAAIFVAALVLLLVFLIGPVSDNHQQEDQSNSGIVDTIAATAAPATTIRYPPFLEDLSIEVITGIEEKKESPYYKANLWIWNDPNRDSYSQERLKQRFYLAMMYYATNGDRWIRKDHWLSYEVSECAWFSHSTYPPDSKYYEPNVCEDINGTSTVINLSLASNNLTGSWPIYYYNFMPFLRILDLGDNQIGGEIPIHSGSSYLEVYILSNNPMGGSLKLNAGAFFDNIKVIRLDGSQTRGNNGGAAFHIFSTGLEILNITGEPNDGQLWPAISILTNLEYVGNGHSDISGTIPTEFGLLTALKELDLSSLPFLSGTIPSELGLLTDLTLLDLAETPLTGTVPSQLCARVQAGLLKIPANCSSLQCCEGM